MPIRRKDAPNLLFIQSDQHRHDILGAHRPGVRTPHLDRLAAEGARFDQCYVSAQACVPSRACMLTGRYAELHRTVSNHEALSDLETTWADVLDRHGYQTMAVGRTHHIDRGFETVRVPYGNSYPMIDYNAVHEVPWGPRGFIERSPARFEEFYEKRVADTAVALMEDLGRNQPFALYVGFIAPHPPFVLPAPFFGMYRPEDMEVSPQAAAPAGARIAGLVKRLYGEHLDERRQRELQAAYLGMVSLMDACVGVLLGGLERLGLLENTLVVYTSDHGEQMGHRGLWNKHTGFDASMRAPLILRRPGVIPAGIVREAMVEQVDLFPTLLEALGVRDEGAARACSGRSFWSAATGGPDAHRDSVYCMLPASGRVWRERDWKLWYEVCPGGEPITELYDLRNDPDEQLNLYHDPRHAAVRDRLMRAMTDFSLTALQEGVSVLQPHARQSPTFNGQFKG